MNYFCYLNKKKSNSLYIIQIVLFRNIGKHKIKDIISNFKSDETTHKLKPGAIEIGITIFVLSIEPPSTNRVYKNRVYTYKQNRKLQF